MDLGGRVAQAHQAAHDGDYQRGLDLARPLIAESELALGEDSALTLRSMGVAGWCLSRLELHEEALEVASLAYDRVEGRAGDDPVRLEAINNLARFSNRAGRPVQAVVLGTEAAQGFCRRFGALAVETLMAQENLLRYRFEIVSQGPIIPEIPALNDDASLLHRISREVLKHDDHVRLAIGTTVARVYALAGRENEAGALAEQVVETYLQGYGAEHPNTIRAQRLLAELV